LGEGVGGPNSDKGTETLVLYVYYNSSMVELFRRELAALMFILHPRLCCCVFVPCIPQTAMHGRCMLIFFLHENYGIYLVYYMVIESF
jgi:hypothetical protein